MMIMMAAMTDMKPIHETIPTLLSVWIDAKRKVPTAAITTQTTVHVAWVVMALKAMEMATKPEPDKKIMKSG